jgi:heme oxygenase (biliverdin-IX-beta and delta-forming)
VSNPSIHSSLLTDPEGQQFNVFDLLKKGTADIHQLIERRLPVFQEGFNLEDYTQLVESFFGFWAPVEERLSKLATLKDPDLGLQSRLKCSLLRKDLLILGCDPTTVPLCDRLPRLDTFFQGLGCLYVLEGSTLGSQIISRRLQEKLQLNEGSGASYFNAYSGSVGVRWMAFKRFVSASVRPEHADNVVEAARQTFMCFYEWLGTTSVIARRP